MDWLVAYADGSTFSSGDGAPEAAPRAGGQEVYLLDEATGWKIEPSRVGHWVWREGQWSGVHDLSGWYDYLFHHPEPGLTLFGRTLKDEEWEQRVSKRGEVIMGLPKQGWRKRERREP